MKSYWLLNLASINALSSSGFFHLNMPLLTVALLAQILHSNHENEGNGVVATLDTDNPKLMEARGGEVGGGRLDSVLANVHKRRRTHLKSRKHFKTLCAFKQGVKSDQP